MTQKHSKNEKLTAQPTLDGRWTWVLALDAILFAITAQVMLSASYVVPALITYLVAGVAWGWTLHQQPAIHPSTPVQRRETAVQLRPTSTWRQVCLLLSLLATFINVAYSWNNTFEWISVLAWIISVGGFMLAYWDGDKDQAKRSHVRCWPKDGDGLRLSWEAVIFWGILALGLGFRLWRLNRLPPDMTWDHTQKLLDVRDVVQHGLRPVFFYRNTGREPLQFYWTALLIRLTGLPVGFTVLKLGAALAGALTLPAVYLMARELYGAAIARWAMFFTAVADWPVWISRMGLRYPFAPLFSAWSFYFMLRGMRTGRRRDFLMLGLCLGAGLYGYTAFRLVPLAVAFAWLLACALGDEGDKIFHNLHWTRPALTIITATLVFIPLGLFMVWDSGAFWGRSAWYLYHNPIPGSPLMILLRNLKNLTLMFHWRGDFMPLSAIPFAPVLTPIAGALLILGAITALYRVLWRQEARTAALLLAGCIAWLPSALALAFPDENPSVVRTGAAIPVIFTLVALPISRWSSGVRTTWQDRGWRALRAVLIAMLLVASVGLNAHRVFVRHAQSYRPEAPNTSEVAAALRSFDTILGDLSNAYVINEGRWLIADAVAFELGLPTWTNMLTSAEEIPSGNLDRPRMYILRLENETDMQLLRSRFPEGRATRYPSQAEKPFVVYIVP
jgi:hypothetical protein